MTPSLDYDETVHTNDMNRTLPTDATTQPTLSPMHKYFA